MVDRALVSQLQSMNAGQRREAIMALGRTKDRAAIPHLSRVAETDPDDELRELARKAAIYIDKHAPVVNVKPFNMPWDDEEESEQAADSEPMSAAATAALTDYEPPTPEDIAETQDLEWAERFIERAWQAHYTSDREGAEMYLRKAFERAPVIAEQDSVREAAGKIMGMNPDRAVNALLKPKTMRRGGKPDTQSIRPPSTTRTTGSIKTTPITPTTGSIKTTPATRTTGSIKTMPAGRTTGSIRIMPPDERPQKTVDEIEDGSMGTMFFDLFIYFIIAFVINLVVLLIFQRLLLEQLNSTTFAPANYTGTYSRDLLLYVNEGGIQGIAVSSALSALLTILQTLFYWFITHVVATTLLGGNSNFPRLIRKTYLYFALSTPVLVALLVVGVFLAALLDDPTVLQTALAIAILGSVFLLAWRIGVAYRFDFARGCFTMILTSIALACCAVTVVIALIAAGVGPFAAIADQLARR